jgi:hypothetical protein
MPVFEKPVLDPEMRGRSNKVRRAAAAVKDHRYAQMVRRANLLEHSRFFQMFLSLVQKIRRFPGAIKNLGTAVCIRCSSFNHDVRKIFKMLKRV